MGPNLVFDIPRGALKDFFYLVNRLNARMLEFSGMLEFAGIFSIFIFLRNICHFRLKKDLNWPKMAKIGQNSNLWPYLGVKKSKLRKFQRSIFKGPPRVLYNKFWPIWIKRRR